MNLPFMPSQYLTDAGCVSGKKRSHRFVILESRNDWGVTIERADLLYATKQGAVICLTVPRMLPDEVAVFFPGDGLQRHGRVRWHVDRCFGIEFDNSPVSLNQTKIGNAGRFVVIEGGTRPECRIDY